MNSPRTLYDKIWDSHVVNTDKASGESLLYIDLHLIHEVTTPQAFAGLRANGRKVRRPDLTLAVADHNTPTEGQALGMAGVKDPEAREQLETLGVTPPPALGAQGPAGLLVTKSGLIFVGGGDRAFHALDTTSGRELWSAPTHETTGTPMTYATADGTQFVVVATGRGPDATLVAYRLP